MLEENGGVYGTGIELFSNRLRVIESGIRRALKFLSENSHDVYVVKFYTTEDENLLNESLRKMATIHRKIKTPVLKLKGKTEEQVFKSLRSSKRRAIRQAQKRGAKVIIKTDADDFSVNEIKHMVSIKNMGTVLSETQILSHVTKELLNKGFLKIFLAKVEERNIAFAYVDTYNKTLGYPAGGMDRNYSYYRPSDAIQWSIIKYGLENHYEEYNMVHTTYSEERADTITKFMMGYNPFMSLINEFSVILRSKKKEIGEGSWLYYYATKISFLFY
ncbi:MAG: peptidoglycan bridge formation glycyltransferase FemA/FemB family protein [Candidatus Bathycorpusculaceae bacterium]